MTFVCVFKKPFVKALAPSTSSFTKGNPVTVIVRQSKVRLVCVICGVIVRKNNYV